MTIDRLISRLSELAAPSSRETIARQPGPECLSREEMGSLLRGDMDEGTLDRVTSHILECDRCMALARLVLREPTEDELADAHAAIGAALERHLAAVPQQTMVQAVQRVITLAMQWLAGPEQPRVAVAGALADEAQRLSATIEVSEGDGPMELRLVSPEGTPADTVITITDVNGNEVFRGRTNTEGVLTASLAPGEYQCHVEGYSGPLLIEEDQ